MRELALFGCIVLLLLVCFIFIFIFDRVFCTDEQENEKHEREVAYWILIIAFIIRISISVVYPESFGYENASIVSDNVIESEVQNADNN